MEPIAAIQLTPGTNPSFTVAADPAHSVTPGVTAGHGISLTDFGRFDQAMQSAQVRLDTVVVQPTTGIDRVAVGALDNVNDGLTRLGNLAERLSGNSGEVSPGDMIRFAFEAQMFAIKAQITSTVASRASDGVSQLFKQQS